jgi:hypothetical protein
LEATFRGFAPASRKIRKTGYTILGMRSGWQQVKKVGRAYLWSILLGAWFAPLMAGQEKVRLLADGIHIPFWKMLLIAAAWCMTAATLAPPIFYIVRRYPVSRPIRFKRIAGYVFGAIPYLMVSVCIRSLLLPPWDPNTGEFTSRTFDAFVNNARLFATQAWDYLVVLVAAHAYEYFTRARNQELERAKLQQALAESELQALKSQLQPHFLFNTLHGISVAQKLEPYGFIRIHRSILVNTSFVEEIHPWTTGEYLLRIKGGKELAVSRTYKKNLRSLAQFWVGSNGFQAE